LSPKGAHENGKRFDMCNTYIREGGGAIGRKGKVRDMSLQHASISRVAWHGKQYRFIVADEKDEIQRDHASGKVYEEEELNLLIKVDRQWKEMVDVGANVGNHSIALNGQFNFRKVVVFEPNPRAAELLRLNIVLNTHPHADPFDTNYIDRVVSDVNGGCYRSEEMFPSNLGSTAFFQAPYDKKQQQTKERSDAPDQGSVDDTARSVTLDYALGPASNVDFLKIDVEGMEVEVLKSACATISRLSPDIFIEFSDDKKHVLDDFCDKYGYRIEFAFNRYPGLSSYFLLPHKGRITS
jgi:FkbM family methyltransferase